MTEMDQVGIIQEVVNRVVSSIEPGWIEMMISYYVEGGQSDCLNSYLIIENGVEKEKSIPFIGDLDFWLRKWQAEMSQGGKQRFTSCKLHLWANGKFDAQYGYEKIDWNALMLEGSNFNK